MILIGLWLAIYFAGIFTPPLLDDVDTIHAEAAREMLLRHDWVTMYTNGLRYLEKAPLMYWGLAASYELFGISDWSTRLPLVLGLLALVLATYWLGGYAFGERGGFLSGVVLVTSIGPYIFTRFLIPDALVALWLTISYYFFLHSLEEETPSRLTCWGFAAACALNVLTKGLIGLVFPIGTIGLYLLLTGNLRHLLKLRLISSTLVFFVLAAPWHILAAIRNPAQGQARGFLWFYFVNEHIMRFLNKRVPPGYDTVPLVLFWAFLVLWLVPWAVFLPQALREVPLRWRLLRAPMDRRQKANLLFLLWALVILLFFSFSTRQEYYTIPALTGRRVAGRRVAVARIRGRRERSRSARRAYRLASPDGDVRGCRSPGFGSAFAYSSTTGWSGSGGPAEEESAGLRFLSGPRTRLYPAGAGDVPRPAPGRFFVLTAGHNSELVDAAPGPPGLGQCGAVVHDGRPC